MRTLLLTIFLFMLPALALQAKTPAQYFGKSYAVVVGIRDYEDSGRWPRLENNENDANEIARLLQSQGFDVESFKGMAASKRAIESYIEDTLAPKLKTNDRVVFYFSGHGETLRKGGKDWGYVIPFDATDQSSSWISMERLQTLAGMMGSARHQLFIFDACFGGTFGLKSSLSATPENVPDYVGVVAQAKARQYLTAGGAKERTPATSNLPGYKKYSFFTAYLIKALREDGGDLNKDGVITASELDAYLGPAATSQYNTPRGGSFAGHEQGNFVLQARSKPVLPITPVGSSSILKGGELSMEQNQNFKLLIQAHESNEFKKFKTKFLDAVNSGPINPWSIRLVPFGTVVENRLVLQDAVFSGDLDAAFVVDRSEYAIGGRFAQVYANVETIECGNYKSSKLVLRLMVNRKVWGNLDLHGQQVLRSACSVMM